jgi:hypothetical protein
VFENRVLRSGLGFQRNGVTRRMEKIASFEASKLIFFAKHC